MSVKQRLAEIVQPAVDLVYPPRCPLCGDAIAEQKGLCASCWSELVIPGEPSCATCQRPLGDSMLGGEVHCAPCLANPPRHDGIAAGTLYNDASRKLILAFKHGRRIALADMLAKLIEARLPKLDGDWLIVPVPLHRTRLWSRGFNQAGLLAQNLSKSTGHGLVVDGLIRTKRTESLGGLGQKARERALAGSITINPACKERLKDAQVLLVDDVLTSGATSDMCVKTLKRAKVSRAVVACFARVLDEALEHGRHPESETPEVRKPRAPRDE